MVHLENNDAIKFLSGLEPSSVDAVVADPPYASGGQTIAQKQQSPEKKYKDSKSIKTYPPFLGDTKDQAAYTIWSWLWMSEAHKALKTGGFILCFTDWRQLGLVKYAMQCSDFTYRGIVVWYKTNSRPQKNSFRQESEFIVWGTKGAKPNINKCLPGIYRYANPSSLIKQHLTEKPLALMKDLLAIVPEGGCVCDPFMGSGTTGVAAKELGLDFLGSEIGLESFEVASLRILESYQKRKDKHE